MAVRLGEMVKGIEGVLGERKKLAQAEKKLVGFLNKALGRMGYQVVPARSVGRGKRRRRRARRKGGAGRRRARAKRG
ncbi:MAG: hypothetical protein ACE5JQ_15365 [Candidatus Methylomirabilales bacterium]